MVNIFRSSGNQSDDVNVTKALIETAWRENVICWRTKSKMDSAKSFKKGTRKVKRFFVSGMSFSFRCSQLYYTNIFFYFSFFSHHHPPHSRVFNSLSLSLTARMFFVSSSMWVGKKGWWGGFFASSLRWVGGGR